MHLYSLYSLPKNVEELKVEGIYLENVKLSEKWDKIFDLWAYSDEDIERSKKRKEFILDWLAYVIQRPENRNATALCISSLEGIGKAPSQKHLVNF